MILFVAFEVKTIFAIMHFSQVLKKKDLFSVYTTEPNRIKRAWVSIVHFGI